MPSDKSFEEILKAVHHDFVKLDEEEVKQTNLVLGNTIPLIIEMLRKESLFKTMYQDLFYGGSFYDNLKIKHPDEFDIHLQLKVPSELHDVKILRSNQRGFVWFKVSDKSTEFNKFIGEKQYVETELVLNWLKGLVCKALQNIKNPLIRMYSESGPALTLQLEIQKRTVLIDLVPVFRFGSDKWPPKPFKQYDGEYEPDFFVVPKKCKNISWSQRFWRISFQNQEREILSGQERLKPALRLLKATKDNLNYCKISSYALKSMILIALAAGDFSRNETLSGIFMALLFRFRQCLKYGIIRNYWYHKENLIKNVDSITVQSYYQHLDKLLRYVKKRFKKNPFIMARLILNEKTGEYDTFVNHFQKT